MTPRIPSIAAARDFLANDLHLCAEVESSLSQTEQRELEWPELSALGDNLHPVPPFALEFIPANFRPLVEDIAERMQVPMDFPGVTLIVALAGCVNRRAAIRPKREDGSWTVVLNLWGGIVGPPGFMKSPVLQVATRSLIAIEERWRAEHDSASAGYEIARERAECDHQALRQQYIAAVKKGVSASFRPESGAQPPARKRLLLTDATYEKLQEILSENPSAFL
jgi:putative DNA primase/helicase